MTQLNEFGINLPMVAVPPMSADTVKSAYDCTAQTTMPADVDTSSCSHIYVYVEGCPQINQIADTPMISMDLVLNVSVTNPVTGTCSTYKVVKRLSMDKCKLAVEAECSTPYQVVEADTPEKQAEKLAEAQKVERAAQAARRARELAGLPRLAEADSNLAIDWRDASPSDKATFKKMGLIGDKIKTACMDDGKGGETCYAMVDGKRYKVDYDKNTAKEA